MTISSIGGSTGINAYYARYLLQDIGKNLKPDGGHKPKQQQFHHTNNNGQLSIHGRNQPGAKCLGGDARQHGAGRSLSRPGSASATPTL